MNTKRSLKIFIIAVSVALGIIAVLFISWLIMPSAKLYVAVLDKTVPATAADGHSYLDNVDNIYRKHLGLNWLMDYYKIINPETGRNYSETQDYYGYLLDSTYELLDEERMLEDMEETPDLLYLSDTYGTEITEDKGITKPEMNMISMCNYAGSTIIGEQDILITATEEDVSEQLQELFGMHETGWVGRYIYDLADMTDVPYWAPPMYKEKYGVEWRCSGSGILLVSSDGDILVFEARKDFEDDSLLKIRIADDYKKEFGRRKVNYYSWFELIEPTGNTETIAEYVFNFNSTGMEKFAPVSDSPIFTAITRCKRSENSAPAYYFAGDFGDYVDDKTVVNFLGADIFYRIISVDRDGDVTHFFWNFYEPVISKIFSQVKKDAAVYHGTDEEKNKPDTEITKFSGKELAIKTDKGWEKFTFKGLNFRAESPGNKTGEYSDDYSYYEDLINELAGMNANTVRAYDLYPPEFYRAVYEYNADHPDAPIYICQSVTLPSGVKSSKLFTKNGREAVENRIKNTVDALHGKLKLEGKVEGSSRYINNLSEYVIAYIIDPGLSDSALKKLAEDKSAKFSGKLLSASGNGAEALLAMMGDYLLSYHNETYGVYPSTFLKGSSSMLKGATWQENNSVTFSPSSIKVDKSIKEKVGAAFSASYNDSVFRELKDSGKTKAEKAYNKYLAQIEKNCKLPTLIDALGASTCINVFDRETDVYGLSEENQASQIVSMHKSVSSRSFAGALIADLNDTWSTAGSEAKAYTVPRASIGLWHDVTDPAQTMGVLSVDPAMPTDIGLDLAQNNERMTDLQLMRNESYLYVTVSLDTDVDYEKEQLFIGFDTYQRNNGEYYYDKKFFGNALSGMEFIIKFESKNAASLYCVPTYNRSKAQLSSKESYTADYELVTPLKYGSFSTQNTQFFQTGNTIHIRLAWAMLNVADPSQRIVLNDTTAKLSGSDNMYETTITTGMVVSVFIGDIESKDTNYIFPSDKQSPGYRRYEWSEWKKENVEYDISEKAAAESLKTYFSTF